MKSNTFTINILPLLIGGSGEIRTHGRVAPSLVFKTSALNRSATLPYKDGQDNTFLKLVLLASFLTYYYDLSTISLTRVFLLWINILPIVEEIANQGC